MLYRLKVLFYYSDEVVNEHIGLLDITVDECVLNNFLLSHWIWLERK